MNTPTRYVSVSQPGRSWGGSETLSSGTVTVTSSTATRVRGSFNLSLRSAVAANGTLAVTGTFDLGLPNP